MEEKISPPQLKKTPWDICRMIVEEELYVGETVMNGSPASMVQSYGQAAIDRINAAQREVDGVQAASINTSSDGTAGKADPRGDEPHGKDTSMQGAGAASGPSEAEYAADWQRQIISAGGDEGLAIQAVTLAALNGLFDHLRAHSPAANKHRDFCEWLTGFLDGSLGPLSSFDIETIRDRLTVALSSTEGKAP